jgi:hypothetical protein
VGSIGVIIIAYACMVAADDKMTASEILATKGGKNSFSGAAIP